MKITYIEIEASSKEVMENKTLGEILLSALNRATEAVESHKEEASEDD